MATDRQIEANRRNAERSSGPKTIEGKARSRVNATRHGMAGESSLVEPGHSAAHDERRAKWGEEYRPVGEAGQWALDRAVAASLQIERCEREVDGLADLGRARARLAWDQDKAIEAATTFERLARDPVLASRQLEATRAGVQLMIEAWIGLASALNDRGGWSELESSRALDLLGDPADLRECSTPIDEADAFESRRALAFEEIDRLEALRDGAMTELDEMERRLAMAGDILLTGKPAQLVLRYERDAWRRYRESIRQVRDSAASPAVSPTPLPVKPVPAPPPAPARPIPVEDPPIRPRAPASIEQGQRAEVRPSVVSPSGLRRAVADRIRVLDLGDGLDSIERFERRMDEIDQEFDDAFASFEGLAFASDGTNPIPGGLGLDRPQPAPYQ